MSEYRYGIITLPDSDRVEYKKAIRRNVPYFEQPRPAFDYRVRDPLEAIEEWGLEFRADLWDNPKKGELAVWLSNYIRWKQAAEHGPLIVFEDDAVVGPDFKTKFEDFMAELPGDWDFAALWVPENQRQDYLYNAVYDENGRVEIRGFVTPERSIYRIPGNTYAALVYQGYGMVSLVYSRKGGKRLVELAHEVGITGPVDCWIYEQAHRGALKGFAPIPVMADIVEYDWAAQSHVQQTERAL
jgi:GR25 family glycosyltransferase involved in LPS biosynthesis